MTQRIFDVENEKDMTDLWDILPDDICKIESVCGEVVLVYNNFFRFGIDDIFSINFHDKTEITRPIQEATEADIGKICYFWNGKTLFIGELRHIEDTDTSKYYEMFAPIAGNLQFVHCRRLTKQEVEKFI